MLLTSSQVSIAVTSGIIILCTFSLFISGYVLQQRTLNTLRAAIREPPRPSPQLILPDRFKGLTTELEDGTIVPYTGDDTTENNGGEAPQIVVKVDDDTTQQAVLVPESGDVEKPETSDNTESNPAVSDPNFQPWAAREEAEKEVQQHKEEVNETESSGDGKPAEVPEDEAVKPLSAAERRRRIKAEIRRLAQGSEPVYYQRRLY